MQKHHLANLPLPSPITMASHPKDIDSDSSMSFGGCGTCSRRSSVSSSTSSSSLYSGAAGRRKPHKANQAAWEAMRRLHHQVGPHGSPGSSCSSATAVGLAGAATTVGLEHFKLLRRLGSGDLGNVYLCQIRNPVVGVPQCFYAMKVVDREALAIRKKLQRAEMEKEILGMLDHPFLPTLYAEFEASHYSCWVMEFCPGGDLYSTRLRQPGKRFTVSSAKFYAAEIILALEYLHMMGIVYRDLKPENVLVREDGHIMLSDFDLSLKCDVVPQLLRRTNGAIYSENDKKSMHNNNAPMPSCVAGPMQPVLSCFSAANRRLRKKSTQIITTITEHVDRHNNCHDQRGDKEEEEEEDDDEVRVQIDGPELVAEPIDARSKSFVGTHEYLAPEVITGQGHGSAVDWWTLGVFLYEMLYGRTPFKGENNKKTLVNILKQPLTFPRIGVSSAKEFEEMVKVQDLICKLLVKNPKKRIGSVKGSVEIKRHEFFKGVNWALIRSVKPPLVPRDLISSNNNNKRIINSSNCNNGVNLRRSAPNYVPKFSKKEREEPYQIPHHVDYF